jgi:hypothetical protein
MQLLERSSPSTSRYLLDSGGNRIGGYHRAEVTVTAPNEGLEEDPYLQADLRLMTQIMAVIDGTYGGHPWCLQVSHAQGVALLSIPPLMGPVKKYVIKIADLKNDPGFKIPLRYAGEILERYAITRGKFEVSEFVDALNAQPKWLRASGRGHVPV